MEIQMDTTFDNFDFEEMLQANAECLGKQIEEEAREKETKRKSRQFYPLYRGFPNGSKEYYDRLEMLDSRGLSEEQIIFTFMENEVEQKESIKIKSRIKKLISSAKLSLYSIRSN